MTQRPTIFLSARALPFKTRPCVDPKGHGFETHQFPGVHLS